MNNIFYIIGKHINDSNTFFNFIISIKNISNKQQLINEKRSYFSKFMIEYRKDNKGIIKTYYLLPNKKVDGIVKIEDKINRKTTTFNCHNGLKNGLYQKMYDGKILSEVYYINGSREGLFNEWYENGQLKKQYIFINNKKEGLYLKWHKNGVVRSISTYINDLKNGLYIKFYKNGQLLMRSNYIEGKKNGRSESWYNNHKICSIYTYFNDMKHGPCIKYKHDPYHLIERDIYIEDNPGILAFVLN
jgi:antitoxin component YwqK of YwqJK toxin-antitoxin module